MDPPLRLAELLAAISLATDVAHDVPPESALRDALLAVELGSRAGWPPADLADVYYVALLFHIGCTGAVAAQSKLGGGDDIAVRRWMSEVDYADRPEMMRVVLTRVAPRWGVSGIAQGITGLATAGRDLNDALTSIGEVAARLAERLGAGPGVSEALTQAHGRWDGRMFPSLPAGPQLSATARLVNVVHIAQTYAQAGGVDAANAVVRQRSGSELDPEMARLWLENSQDLASILTADSVWDEVLSAEPRPPKNVAWAHLDTVCAALADFVDLASPYTRGHSVHVARLVEAAARQAGLDEETTAGLRRAGLVHDLGMVGVPNRVLIKSGPMTRTELERVRLHPYQTFRILSIAAPLRGIAATAALHHEHIDGSGYHRGLHGSDLPFPARMLAVAEMFESMREDRARRPAIPADRCCQVLREEGSAGRLDGRAVEIVLQAAGQSRSPRRSGRTWPAHLTDREVDVLRELARGLTNKQIAVHLHVSEATVHTHLINIYGKAGLSTRAGATLFAMEHDLLDI